MYQYKVDIYKLKYAEEAMNAYAKEGWRVISVSPNHHDGFVDVVYEREAPEDAAEAAAPTDTAADAAEKPADIKPEIQYAVRDDIWDFDGTYPEESEEEE